MATSILSSVVVLVTLGAAAGNNAYFSAWNNNNCTGDLPTTFPDTGKIQENMQFKTAPADLGVCAEVTAKRSPGKNLVKPFSVQIVCGTGGMSTNVTQYYDSNNCSSAKLMGTYSFTAGNFTTFKAGTCSQATYKAASGATSLPDKSVQLTGVLATVLCKVCGDTCPTTPPPAAANSTNGTTNGTTTKKPAAVVPKGNSGAGSLHASFYVLFGLAVAVISTR